MQRRILAIIKKEIGQMMRDKTTLCYELDVEHLRDDLARYIVDVQEINNRLLGRES